MDRPLGGGELPVVTELSERLYSVTFAVQTNFPSEHAVDEDEVSDGEHHANCPPIKADG